jgi:hypothetical protein
VIRTHDPLRPRQVRYQAALRPDMLLFDFRALHSIAQSRQSPQGREEARGTQYQGLTNVSLDDEEANVDCRQGRNDGTAKCNLYDADSIVPPSFTRTCCRSIRVNSVIQNFDRDWRKVLR